MSYKTRGGSGYGTKSKRSATGFSGKGKKKDVDFTSKYLRGEISEATWRKHLNAERRSNAPSLDSVLDAQSKRAFEQGKSTNSNERFNGWTNWDTWNTMLLLDNTRESNNWLDTWSKNFARKVEQGKFNAEEAEKVVAKYLIPAARGAKAFLWAVGRDFTPDPEINPKKVNKAEIVHNLLDRYRDNLRNQ